MVNFQGIILLFSYFKAGGKTQYIKFWNITGKSGFFIDSYAYKWGEMAHCQSTMIERVLNKEKNYCVRQKILAY